MLDTSRMLFFIKSVDALYRERVGPLLETNEGLTTDWAVVKGVCNRFDKRHEWSNEGPLAVSAATGRKLDEPIPARMEEARRWIKSSTVLCTLPKGGTNSVAHMVNAMNTILRDCIPNVTMPFLDDIPIKGCPVEEKDESFGPDRCRGFVKDHINDCEMVLERLEGARITFSGEKSAFGQSEILVVSHLCGPYGWKPSLTKVEEISVMKEEC